MHVANLQLEGLLMAVASINNVLVRKGILSVREIDEALAKAESGLMADVHVAGGHERVEPRRRLLPDPLPEARQSRPVGGRDPKLRRACPRSWPG